MSSTTEVMTREAVLEAVLRSAGAAGRLGTPAINRWNGYTFTLRNGFEVRLLPVDGEWDAGLTITVLSANGVCHAEHNLRGATPRMVAVVLNESARCALEA